MVTTSRATVAFVSTALKDLPATYQGSHAPEEPLDLMYAIAATRQMGRAILCDPWTDAGAAEIAAADAVVISTTNSYLQWNNHPLGLGLFSSNFQKVNSLIGRDTPTLVFGPHVPSHRDEILAMGASATLLGEAELQVPAALGRLLNRESLEGIPGAANALSAPAAVVDDLNDLPLPAYDATVGSAYSAHNCPDPKFTAGHLYEASRGCPYQCTYCNTITHRRRYRTKTPAKIENDLRELAELTDRRYVYFIDESFGFDSTWHRDVVGRLQSLPFSYGCQGNLKFATFEKLEAMARARFVNVEFGFETGAAKLLRMAKKDNRLDDAHLLINRAAELGLNPLLFVLMGLPGEDLSSLDATFEFLGRLDPRVRISVAIPTPYAGTQLFDIGVKNSVLSPSTKGRDLYRFSGRIGHDLRFEADAMTVFLDKYGPNNYLSTALLAQLQQDTREVFGHA